MRRVFSNGPAGDFVCNPFDRLLAEASRIHLAAPYFTEADGLVAAARAGKTVQLLVGLNASTTPAALKKTMNVPGLAVRYLTRRFHAKIYIFDAFVLLGSSNLTDNGLRSNREAVIQLDPEHDPESIDEVRGLFLELWESAASLTDIKMREFEEAWRAARPKWPDPDVVIEAAVGLAEPSNISVSSRHKSRERVFLDELHRLVLEQYRPAFREVTHVLVSGGYRRPDLAAVGEDNETNRFLSWVRQTHAAGDGTWLTAPLRSQSDRQALISDLGAEWSTTKDSKVPDIYLDWLDNVQRLFGTPGALASASRDDLTEGLMSLHAFEAQARFTKGGAANLPNAFWTQNKNDAGKVRNTLQHLLYGPGDFVGRLHDIVYLPGFKLNLFGKFCALELYGTLHPDECPPMNGRMAKGLRFLGFDVPPNG